MGLRSFVTLLFRGYDPDLDRRLSSSRAPQIHADLEASERRLARAQSSFDDAIAGVVADSERRFGERDAGPFA